MKVIDLINMISNNEKLPDKMIINKRNFHSNVFKSMVYEGDCNTDIWMAIKLQHIDLDDYVKITEEDTIDIDSIEELETTKEIKDLEDASDLIHRNEDMINELVKVVKQLNRELKELK